MDQSMAADCLSSDRRSFVLGSAGVAATALLASPVHASPQRKPNIIFILADDLGYADVSCYGRREYQTPSIDSLARDGARFTQAYANSAVSA